MSNEVSTAALGFCAAGDDASLMTGDGDALPYGSPYLELYTTRIEKLKFFTQLFN